VSGTVGEAPNLAPTTEHPAPALFQALENGLAVPHETLFHLALAGKGLGRYGIVTTPKTTLRTAALAWR
jgi:hypothetical protein